MKLNLGCSDSHVPGFINVDCVPPADQIADLGANWPWEDSSVAYIKALDIIEHLPNKMRTMNEAWRVLIPGGLLEIVVPTTDGPGAWQDPTHVSYWNRNSFLYYTAGDPHRERFGEAYEITARFEVVSSAQWKDSYGVVKLSILLKAVK